jgi:tyrosyl-tRNA synthetase
MSEFSTEVKTGGAGGEATPAPATASASATPAGKVYRTSDKSVEEKVAIACSVGEEVIAGPDGSVEELITLFTKKPHPVVYDGFEPSGRMHIAQGVLRAINVNKLTSIGCVFKFWVADWFAQLNNKMDGDLDKIRTVGQYMIEIWKAIGMDMTNVEFLWCSDSINEKAGEYWSLVMDIARSNNLARIQRCCQIMGRKEGDELSAAQIFYPCMQCADVFFLKADICQLGLDQRKVNMLAREYASDKKKKVKKPVIISHHMLSGLKEGQEKMSKSEPDSAIFMEDSVEDVNRKIKKGYCPPTVVEKNPILDYAKHIIFGYYGELTVNLSGSPATESSEATPAGPKTYKSYAELEADYIADKVGPQHLKPAVAEALNKILEPVRKHFESGEPKKLLDKIKAFKVTR